MNQQTFSKDVKNFNVFFFKWKITQPTKRTLISSPFTVSPVSSMKLAGSVDAQSYVMESVVLMRATIVRVVWLASFPRTNQP